MNEKEKKIMKKIWNGKDVVLICHPDDLSVVEKSEISKILPKHFGGNKFNISASVDCPIGKSVFMTTNIGLQDVDWGMELNVMPQMQVPVVFHGPPGMIRTDVV